MNDRSLGILLCVMSVACTVGIGTAVATEPIPPEAEFTLGQKVTVEHRAKSVIGPSVAVDERGTVHLAWMQEDKQGGQEVRSVRYARTVQAGGSLGAAVQVNRPEELPYWRQEAPALVVNGDAVFLTWASTHPKAGPENPLPASCVSAGPRTAGGPFCLPCS